MSFKRAKDQLSQLDLGGVLKNSHDFDKSAQRNVEIKEYDRFEVSYDSNMNISQVDYYQDKQNAVWEITLVGDNSGSLNGKYWFLNGSKNKRNYYIWYNVNGTGTDPAIPNRTGIEVGINTNDPAQIVAFATRQILMSELSDQYTTTGLGLSSPKLTIQCMFKGIVNDPQNITMPIFNYDVKQEGTETLLRSLYLEYDANGCLLKYDKVEIDVGC